jgi:hypothetical protein
MHGCGHLGRFARWGAMHGTAQSSVLHSGKELTATFNVDIQCTAVVTLAALLGGGPCMVLLINDNIQCTAVVTLYIYGVHKVLFGRNTIKFTVIYGVLMYGSGQNHIYTVYIRYFWQEYYQIYGNKRGTYVRFWPESYIYGVHKVLFGRNTIKFTVIYGVLMYGSGQNHIYTVYIRCFWQEYYQIYGNIRRTYVRFWPALLLGSVCYNFVSKSRCHLTMQTQHTFIHSKPASTCLLHYAKCNKPACYHIFLHEMSIFVNKCIFLLCSLRSNKRLSSCTNKCNIAGTFKLLLLFVGLARTVYTHRIWPYFLYPSCRKYRTHTIYEFGPGQLHLFVFFKVSSEQVNAT